MTDQNQWEDHWTFLRSCQYGGSTRTLHNWYDHGGYLTACRTGNECVGISADSVAPVSTHTLFEEKILCLKPCYGVR